MRIQLTNCLCCDSGGRTDAQGARQRNTNILWRLHSLAAQEAAQEAPPAGRVSGQQYVEKQARQDPAAEGWCATPHSHA